MGIGALNSSLTRKGYVNQDFAEIWEEPSTLSAIIEVEATLAEVQAELGIIPSDAASEIRKNARLNDELFERARNGKVGNPLIASLDAIRANVPEDVRGWVHYGATSQDILDTARALQISESISRLDKQIDTLDEKTSRLAVEHASTVMVARTNGQHALPTTLGMRFARWAKEVRRSRERLRETAPRATMIQFSGAAGTYASMSESGLDVAKLLAERLGLTFEAVPWHASRDGITELCCNVAIYAQSLAKIAEDLFDMQRTDFGEAREQMDAHSSGSSTMPQKLNPFTTMKISVGARMAAGLAATVLTQPPASFERDHRSLEVERDALPQILIATEGSGYKLLALLDKLDFNVEQMYKNAQREGVLLLSENVMMHLASELGQEQAHDLIQEFAALYRSTGISFDEFFEQKAKQDSRLKDIDVSDACKIESYLGLSESLATETGRQFNLYIRDE